MLYVDCRELQKVTSDSQLVNELAHQTGYWPIFTLFNSMGNLIDLASIGIIGQKGMFWLGYRLESCLSSDSGFYELVVRSIAECAEGCYHWLEESPKGSKCRPQEHGRQGGGA